MHFYMLIVDKYAASALITQDEVEDEEEIGSRGGVIKYGTGNFRKRMEDLVQDGEDSDMGSLVVGRWLCPMWKTYSDLNRTSL